MTCIGTPNNYYYYCHPSFDCFMSKASHRVYLVWFSLHPNKFKLALIAHIYIN